MSSNRKPISRSSNLRVGITIGDPAGIGPYITARALEALKGKAQFVVIGDRWVFDRASFGRKPVYGANFIDLANVRKKTFAFGRIRAAHGKASIEYLDAALEMLGAGQLDCLVTCPISKEAVSRAGYGGFSGHTEYLAARTAVKDYVMMLLNRHLKIGLVTRHLPIRGVPEAIEANYVRTVIRISAEALKSLFGIPSPRIVVCGLNPHASDNGLLGGEERAVIAPVVKQLQRSIANLAGPEPADVAIAAARKGEYDCVIAMYHDQALIPLKLSTPHEGVNMTLGLPFVRTSPLHGTAFDIAGRPLACPDSLIAAIKTAIQCTLNQKKD
ncbi:MAG TPA: 4-hydroxythreonine-4-phosphate dehydrogenase PdxA [Patescibacteria group bacterium]|nr:4-hydroxythreonine-4-phosphate dehydrogenase PdxA [Patescibacteria group bacterium]